MMMILARIAGLTAIRLLVIPRRGHDLESSHSRIMVKKRSLEGRHASPDCEGRVRDGPTRPGSSDRPDRATSELARAAPVVRRQRLRGADLRDRLAPTLAACHRLDRCFPRRIAGDLHGRYVCGKLASSAS